MYLCVFLWTVYVWAFGLIGMALPKIQAENAPKHKKHQGLDVKVKLKIL
jgi:hypothetical protein